MDVEMRTVMMATMPCAAASVFSFGLFFSSFHHLDRRSHHCARCRDALIERMSWGMNGSIFVLLIWMPSSEIHSPRPKLLHEHETTNILCPSTERVCASVRVRAQPRGFGTALAGKFAPNVCLHPLLRLLRVLGRHSELRNYS